MNALLLDTNIVSILFVPHHRSREDVLTLVTGHELVISFMSRAELYLWPVLNQWGAGRRELLLRHLELYTPLFPDETTCHLWSDVVAQCRRKGRPIHTADAWIAATAKQWSLPLVTANVSDFETIDDLRLIPLTGASDSM